MSSWTERSLRDCPRQGQLFGRLQHRLWNDHGICLATKPKSSKQQFSPFSYKVAKHGNSTCIKQLDAFHLRCLCSICNIKWYDKVPNTEVLARCEFPGVESLLIKAQLRWAGHVVRMEDTRLPKALYFLWPAKLWCQEPRSPTAPLQGHS